MNSLRNEPKYIEYSKGAVPVNAKMKPQCITYNEIIETPNLLAKYLILSKTHDDIYIDDISNASSNEYFVLEGSGKTIIEKSPNNIIEWKKGDVFILPFQSDYISHIPYDENTILFKITDSPLLAFLKCKPFDKKFLPTYFPHEEIMSNLNKFNEESDSLLRNRNGVLLTTDLMIQQKLNTISHTMWTLYNYIAPHTTQNPHRHNSVAIDLCIDVDDDASDQDLVYTLMGEHLDENNNIINPTKMVWKKNQCFSTPPGWWHSHHNDSDKPAWVLPVQDAGLHTHMQTLNISFV